jgi:hypothetical protein
MISVSKGSHKGMRTKNLADLYELPNVDWALITDRLDGGLTVAPGTGGPNHHSFWLATTNADGSPHVTGVGSQWIDGAFWFVSGESTRKSRNVARDPRCSLSLGTAEFDLVIDGDAHKVTDPATVAKIAAEYAKNWPCEVDASGIALTAPYSAPSAGPAPWFIYRITIRSANALSLTEPGGATRWDFD